MIPYVGKPRPGYVLENRDDADPQVFARDSDFIEHRPTKYQGFAPPIFRTTLAAADFNGGWHTSRRGAE